MTKKKLLLSGNEACVEGALYAGIQFYGGYPITPSSEIAEGLARKLPKYGGVMIQMEDEIASMGSIIGASLTGKKSMTATSGPGFSLKQENLGFACFNEIPCVIVNVMRGGPSTGAPTGPSQGDVMQARWGTHGDHEIVALTPNSIPEIFTETVRAFNISEKYRVPVILLLDEIIAHMRETITLPEKGELEVIDRQKPTVPPERYKPFDVTNSPLPLVPPMAAYGAGYRFHVTGLNHRTDGFPTNNGEIIETELIRIRDKMEMYKNDMFKWEEYMLDDADVGIVAYGSSSRAAKYAVNVLRKEGIKAGMLRYITVWPFADKLIEKLASKVKFIIVPELNFGQLRFEIERSAKGKVEVYGVNRVNIEIIHPEYITDKVKEILHVV
ncbi:MAG: 2-oxoacid:acceptor oxidoreductase subunit alpha [Deltaproteobacteria bacterium]|nr:2-oxoacid:acceptor oxidoreductase subunit alpha [Deltaproteobacteria bacterium]MCL5792484.1 2-oxoacid:acceptor oxidoreductase subunit alpha [Deltaproteobacteria bacterium]